MCIINCILTLHSLVLIFFLYIISIFYCKAHLKALLNLRVTNEYLLLLLSLLLLVVVVVVVIVVVVVLTF